jgi:hypothetical protein
MSQFGEVLFSKSRFVRWTLSPVLLLFLMLFPLVIDGWTLKRIGLAAGIELLVLSLLAGYWLPEKYARIAFRIAAGLTFLAYVLYLIDKALFSKAPLTLTGSLGASSPRNAILGSIIIGLPCLWYSIFGRFSFSKPSLSDNSQPESSYVVHLSNNEVACQFPNGQIQRVLWNDLQSVVVRTTSDGPALPDVFWILSGSESRCVIPQGATGDKELLGRLLKLPDFDSEAFIAAMGSTDDQDFVCWRRPVPRSV